MSKREAIAAMRHREQELWEAIDEQARRNTDNGSPCLARVLSSGRHPRRVGLRQVAGFLAAVLLTGWVLGLAIAQVIQ